MDEIEQLLLSAEVDAALASDEIMRLMAEFSDDSLLLEFVSTANELRRESRALMSGLQQLKAQAPSSTRNMSIQVLLTRATNLSSRAARFKSIVMEVSRND